MGAFDSRTQSVCGGRAHLRRWEPQGVATRFADANVVLPPIVADNMMYILDDSGRITAFR